MLKTQDLMARILTHFQRFIIDYRAVWTQECDQMLICVIMEKNPENKILKNPWAYFADLASKK